MKPLPKRYTRFQKQHPGIAAAYEQLGAACHAAGPLDAKTRALVKVALSVGAKLEGGAHSHVRKALEAGVGEDELRHVALLAIPTLGFPSAMAAMSWIDDVVEGKKGKGGKR